MILRRFTQHVKDQNWFAVGLDLAIVILGVFIGMQVSNWNQTLADQARGRDYVQRLIADLETDLAMRNALIAYYDAVDESGELTVELLSSPAPDPEMLVINAYRATEFATDPAIRATWDEIVSSGDLGLLPRAAPTASLALYYDSDHTGDIATTLGNSAYRIRVRRAIPHRVQEAIRSGCSDVRNANGSVIGFQPECQLELDGDDIPAAAEALLSDPELLADLRYQFSILGSTRANLRGDTLILTRVIADLEAASQGGGVTR
ncbi:hypothetical protein V0U79_06150 [Hyphobacterium sp. HN65]|uniref:CHASE domain-containing protein n=1 Tax=Hyphobacterium lacteum TaxID=3116575 RepID=A0ABU7LPU5_9PROT|nr:hypothetical protein [Hyphobacterium sp. HN65]MEE2525941.1 hypothetical protein [Hyphobacterium sp. HN65]